MFDIYIKNYKTRSGTYVTNENLLYSIPMDPDEENTLGEPKCSVGMGKAGNFEFTMQVGHPYYESLLQMKTIFRIVYDGDTIFRGRVVTIDVGHMTGNKKVHCEGDYCFLLDTQIEGVEDAKRSKTNALVYMQALIAQHNAQVANDMLDKQFTLGEVPGQYTNAVTTPQRLNPDSDYRYGSSSWKDSQAAFNELSDSFGGFWRTRYQNGTVYLDWLDSYYDPTINDQTIELAENLLEITSSSEVNNIFTALIPIGSAKGKNIYLDDYKTDIHGANKYILVPQILNVFSDEELNSGFHSKQDYQKAIEQYGWICKAESFSNASTKAKLWEYATDFIKNNYCGGLAKFSISAVDMHAIGEQVGKFLIGGRVNVIYPDVDKRDTDPEAMIHKTLTVMEATYELHNPEKNQYVIGIPNAILKKNYGEKSRKSKGSGAGPAKSQEEKNEVFDTWTEYTKEMVWQFIIDGSHNSEEYNSYVNEYGQEAAAAIQKIAHIAVGGKLNQVPGADSSHSMYNMILNAKGIEMTGPMNPAAVKMATDLGEATRSVIIRAGEAAKKAGIEINPVTPEVALSWGTSEMRRFKDMVAAKFTADDDGSAKLELKTTSGQTSSSAGTNLVSTLIEGGKGKLTTVKAALSQSLAGVQDVIDENAIPGLDLNGTLTKITGNKGDLNMFRLSGNSGFGEFDFKKTIQDATTGDLSSITTLLGSGTDGSVKGGDGDANKGWTFSISGAEQRGDFGKDDSGNWLVRVNDKVTYSDEQGTEHTLEPGFVTANDFKIASIPSFKTKFAIVDTLVAGKVNTADLTAELAYIAKLASNTIDADTSVRAGTMYASTISVTGSIAAGAIVGSPYVQGSQIWLLDGDGNRSIQITGSGINDLKILTPEETGTDTYTLQKKTYGSPTWTNVGTFSRATSLDGEWSGRTYTVTASPQGETDSVTVDLSIGSSWDYDDDLDKYRKTVQIRSGTRVVQTDYVDKPAPTLQSKTATSNGTITADSGYEGLSSVVVNVPSGGGSSSDIDLQVGSATTRVPSADGYTSRVFMQTLSQRIIDYGYGSQTYYIPITATAPGCTGTKLYYIRVGGFSSE